MTSRTNYVRAVTYARRWLMSVGLPGMAYGVIAWRIALRVIAGACGLRLMPLTAGVTTNGWRVRTQYV